MVLCMYIYIPYKYKFLRDVIFAGFADNMSSSKIKSLKFLKTTWS